MSEFLQGPCTPWITIEELISCCDEIDSDTSEEILQRAINIASNTLYTLSGSQYKGTCQRTVEVCTKNCKTSRCLEGCPPKDDCAKNELDIGYWPLKELISIKFDGVEQLPDEEDEEAPESNFRINDYRYIEMIDGQWPKKGVEITFEYGIEPPELGKQAAKEIASEITKACLSLECKLPERASQVARRGVTISIGDYKQLAKDFIGLYFVDLFLQTHNPTKMRNQPLVIGSRRKRKTRRIGT